MLKSQERTRKGFAVCRFFRIFASLIITLATNMEQENEKKGGGASLGLWMAGGVMLGTAFGTATDNTGTGIGIGLLAGYMIYILTERKDDKGKD